MQQKAVLNLIKKERPWAFVIALTRTPNIYELFEVRRSFFDDYIYLPVDPDILITIFNLSISRVNRWRQIKYSERRKNLNGSIINRKNFRFRGEEEVKSDE